SADHQLPHMFDRVETEPGPRWRFWPAVFHKLVENRLQPVDRHIHVAGESRRARSQRLLHQQGAHAQQLAVGADQRRAAPQRIGRHGENGVVEQVLPVARELAAARDLDLERRLLAAHARDISLAAQRELVRIAHLHWPDLGRKRGADEAKTALVVVADDAGRDGIAVDIGDADGIRLHNEISDRHDQAFVIDDDAVALALGTQGLGRTAILRDGGMHADHGRQRVGNLWREAGAAGTPRLHALVAARPLTRAIGGTVQPTGHYKPPRPRHSWKCRRLPSRLLYDAAWRR